MDKKIIEEFETENNIEIIKKLIEINNGYVTSRVITELGIHRMYLNIMLKKGIIEKVSKGIYINKNAIEDDYYTFQLRYPKVIFSRFTALYFYGLTEVYPHNFELTVDYNYHVEEINKKHSVFKCSKQILELGLTEVYTPLNHKVRAYDRERCICDLIKYRAKLDIEQVKKTIKMYINDSNKDFNKLSEYSKIMGINKEVMEFIGMFYE